jgi:DNA-directed RNA polymerase subunit N
MIIPIRCFTCGKVIGGRYEEFKRQVEAGKNPKDVMDTLGIERYCCRRMFITHVDLIDDVLPFG